MPKADAAFVDLLRAELGEVAIVTGSDADDQTIDAYGIRNTEAAGSRIDGVPYPGTFIVDQKGIIRSKLFLEGYKKRHAVEALTKALKNAK